MTRACWRSTTCARFSICRLRRSWRRFKSHAERLKPVSEVGGFGRNGCSLFPIYANGSRSRSEQPLVSTCRSRGRAALSRDGSFATDLFSTGTDQCPLCL
jgi:hypothetical protein